MIHLAKHLSCPIIRPARIADAADIAWLQINTDSEKVSGVFKDNVKGAFEVLENQYSKHHEGVFVLTEEERIIGVMKLHLPGRNTGKTLSLRSLISILGFRKGIRAALLLSTWDEYRLSAGESYLEYLYVDTEWQGYGGGKLLVNKAIELSRDSEAKYLSLFTSKYNYRAQGLYESFGFVTRRKMYSPIAKILGANSAWVKQTFTLINGPITVKEYVQDKIKTAKQIWRGKRADVVAAIRLTVALTIIPIIAGIYAFSRGYPLAVLFWIIVGTFHLIGAKLIMNGSSLGKFGILIAMLPEGINILNRSVNAESWFDRGYLLPLAFLNIWILFVIFSYSFNPSTLENKSKKSLS